MGFESFPQSVPPVSNQENKPENKENEKIAKSEGLENNNVSEIKKDFVPEQRIESSSEKNDKPEEMTEKQDKASEFREKVAEELKRLGEVGYLTNIPVYVNSETEMADVKDLNFKWIGEINGHKIELHWDPRRGKLFEDSSRSTSLKIDGNLLGDPMAMSKLGISRDAAAAMEKEFLKKHEDLIRLANKELVMSRKAEDELSEMEVVKEEPKEMIESEADQKQELTIGEKLLNDFLAPKQEKGPDEKKM